MGSVRFYKWRGQKTWFIDFIAADGRRKRQTIGPGEDNYRLAKQILEQREAEATLGKHHVLPSETPHFAFYVWGSEDVPGWLKRKAGRVKPKTLELYEDILTHHLLPVFGQKRLGAITRRDIEEYSHRSRLRRSSAEGRSNGRCGLPLRRSIIA